MCDIEVRKTSRVGFLALVCTKSGKIADYEDEYGPWCPDLCDRAEYIAGFHASRMIDDSLTIPEAGAAFVEQLKAGFVKEGSK